MKYKYYQFKDTAPWRGVYNKDTFTMDDYELKHEGNVVSVPGGTSTDEIVMTFLQYSMKKNFPKDFNGRELKTGDLLITADGLVYYYEIFGYSLIQNITKG